MMATERCCWRRPGSACWWPAWRWRSYGPPCFGSRRRRRRRHRRNHRCVSRLCRRPCQRRRAGRCAPSSGPVWRRPAAAVSIGSMSHRSRSSRRSMRVVRSPSTPPCCARRDARAFSSPRRGAITKVAAFGDALPGGGTLAEFAAHPLPALNAAGHVAFVRPDRRRTGDRGGFPRRRRWAAGDRARRRRRAGRAGRCSGRLQCSGAE